MLHYIAGEYNLVYVLAVPWEGFEIFYEINVLFASAKYIILALGACGFGPSHGCSTLKLISERLPLLCLRTRPPSGNDVTEAHLSGQVGLKLNIGRSPNLTGCEYQEPLACKSYIPDLENLFECILVTGMPMVRRRRSRLSNTPNQDHSWELHEKHGHHPRQWPGAIQFLEMN
jgi:hypothetical protein